MSAPDPQAINGRRRLACHYCRRKKIRCNGGHPCTNCLDHRQECVTATKRRSRKANKLGDVDDRLLRLENLLQTFHKAGETRPEGEQESLSPSFVRPTMPPSDDNQSQQSRPAHASRRVNPAVMANNSPQARSRQTHPQDCMSMDNQGTAAMEKPPMVDFNKAVNQSGRLISGTLVLESSQIAPPGASQGLPLNTLAVRPHSQSHTRAELPREVHSLSTDGGIPLLEKGIPSAEEGGSVYSGETTNWEYHGPRSWLSICSRLAVQWVIDKVGNQSFSDAASAFTKDITRRLKIDMSISRDRYPDPPADVAWEYTQAYFEEANEAAFGVVHRPWFENKLRAHLRDASGDDDPAWYALRNVILATGCRIVLSRTRSFSEAKREAWRYFQNALSMHLELLYLRTSLMSVQTLTIMTAFTGSMGSPCLEYVMCGVAMRLACSKGLHREPVGAWNLSPHEACQRDWVFWALYCLERQIVNRSGRPQMISDEDISCQVPTSAPGGGFVNMNFCQISIKLSQFSSTASRRISPKSTSIQGPQEFAVSIDELNEQLKSWKRSIQLIIDFDKDIDLAHLPDGLSLQQTVHLYFCYFNIVLEMQGALIKPWSKALFGPMHQELLESAFEKSAAIAAEICRRSILTTKYVHINANVSDLVAFHGPMNAMIHLFIYILERPYFPTVRSDLALLEFGAGHFARLEYDTNSEYPIPFARRLADLARLAVDRATTVPLPNPDRDLPCESVGLATDTSFSGIDDLEQQFEMDLDLPWNQISDMNAFDLELENWSALVPTLTPPDGLASF